MSDFDVEREAGYFSGVYGVACEVVEGYFTRCHDAAVRETEEAWIKAVSPQHGPEPCSDACTSCYEARRRVAVVHERRRQREEQG